VLLLLLLLFFLFFYLYNYLFICLEICLSVCPSTCLFLLICFFMTLFFYFIGILCVNAAIIYPTLPSTFLNLILSLAVFFSRFSFNISSLVRVLLTISSHEIYWKNERNISENTVHSFELNSCKNLIFYNYREWYRHYGKSIILLDLSIFKSGSSCGFSFG